jgi:phospholipase D-like protein
MNTILLGFIGPWQIALILIILLFVLILPIAALIDILKNKFEGNNKLIWILLIIFLGLIGVLLYYFIGRKQKIN